MEVIHILVLKGGGNGCIFYEKEKAPLVQSRKNSSELVGLSL